MLPGSYTPHLQGEMSRLGSKLPFAEAAEEIWRGHHLQVSEPTLRRLTYRSGEAAEALARAQVEMLEREAPPAPSGARQLLVSADGTFIPLVKGQWREVKSVAVGEFATVYKEKTWTSQVRAQDITYFTRSYAAQEFERYALGELHRRGLEQAQTVVAVNDGAAWIQGFLDYHAPHAVRIIDFAHAAGYLAQAGKAFWEEESEAFKGWFAAACHGLKHKPPAETIANLRLLQRRAKTAEQEDPVDTALFYLQSRLSMIDYAHFRRREFPIGSGCVESGHKVVVQRRMEGAGMRWAEHHVDPLLALRNLITNDRWDEGWQQTVLFRQEQQVRKRLARAQARQPPPSPPLTFAALEAAGLLPDDEESDLPSAPGGQKWRPADDHPWRKGLWPTRESWRWN